MSEPKEITTKDREGFEKEAHKQIVRGRHRLILEMASKGKTKDEINGVVMMIDWKQEQEWVAEELEQTEKLKRATAAAAVDAKTPAPVPVQIPIPPSQSN